MVTLNYLDLAQIITYTHTNKSFCTSNYKTRAERYPGFAVRLARPRRGRDLRSDLARKYLPQESIAGFSSGLIRSILLMKEQSGIYGGTAGRFPYLKGICAPPTRSIYRLSVIEGFCGGTGPMGSSKRRVKVGFSAILTSFGRGLTRHFPEPMGICSSPDPNKFGPGFDRLPGPDQFS